MDLFFAEARRRLKPGAVPRIHVEDPSPSKRSMRSKNRRRIAAKSDIVEEALSAQQNPPDIGAEVVIPFGNISSTAHPASSERIPSDTEETSEIKPPNTKIYNLHSKPDIIKYYTSFDSYEHFQLLFSLLGPSVSHLGLKLHLAPEDQLFLTLMKLRQAKDDFELSVFFDIRPNQVSLVFSTWINFMFYQLKELCIWPESDIIKQHMPSHFRQSFPNTRAILDATEIPIQKPQSSGPQRETFSSYKNKNTLKVMVGCTPRGNVSYVSDAYGGSASDRQIIERGELVTTSSPLMPGDSIMADRGIMVQDLFASKDINVNTPSTLKGKSQLEPEQVVKDRKVASKRIHIERIIGLAKTFKILKRDLNSNFVILGNRIIHVCFYLCNFRPSILTRYS